LGKEALILLQRRELEKWCPWGAGGAFLRVPDFIQLLKWKLNFFPQLEMFDISDFVNLLSPSPQTF
jgi:hypothetical protein